MVINTRKILMVCLVISVISTLIIAVSSIIRPEANSNPGIISSGIVTVVLIIVLLISKKPKSDRN